MHAQQQALQQQQEQQSLEINLPKLVYPLRRDVVKQLKTTQAKPVYWSEPSAKTVLNNITREYTSERDNKSGQELEKSTKLAPTVSAAQVAPVSTTKHGLENSKKFLDANSKSFAIPENSSSKSTPLQQGSKVGKLAAIQLLLLQQRLEAKFLQVQVK